MQSPMGILHWDLFTLALLTAVLLTVFDLKLIATSQKNEERGLQSFLPTLVQIMSVLATCTGSTFVP